MHVCVCVCVCVCVHGVRGMAISEHRITYCTVCCALLTRFSSCVNRRWSWDCIRICWVRCSIQVSDFTTTVRGARWFSGLCWQRREFGRMVEFMYLVFTRMPGGSYCRRLGFLLLYLFRALISSLCVCAVSYTHLTLPTRR